MDVRSKSTTQEVWRSLWTLNGYFRSSGEYISGLTVCRVKKSILSMLLAVYLPARSRTLPLEGVDYSKAIRCNVIMKSNFSQRVLSKLKRMINDLCITLMRLCLAPFFVSVENSYYPLIRVKPGIAICLFTMHGKTIYLKLKNGPSNEVKLMHSSKKLQIPLLNYEVEDPFARFNFFPLSYIESDLLEAKMITVERHLGKIDDYNIIINPNPKGENVNLGVMDGYFHLLLEFIPLMLKYPQLTFVGNAKYHGQLIKCLEFFNLDFVSQFRSDEKEVWEKLAPIASLKQHFMATRIPGSIYPDYESISIVRREVLRRIEVDAPCDTKSRILFVSRNSDTKSRNLVNEQELLYQLGKRFDVDCITPSDMSLNEQFCAFRGARVIIGPHGAGLSNILVTRPQSLVIELNKDSDVRWHYYRMSKILNLKHHLVIGSSTKSDEILVSERNIESILNKIESATKDS